MVVLFYTGEKGFINGCTVLHQGEGGYKWFYTREKGFINGCTVLHRGEGGYKWLYCVTPGRRGL